MARPATRIWVYALFLLLCGVAAIIANNRFDTVEHRVTKVEHEQKIVAMVCVPHSGCRVLDVRQGQLPSLLKEFAKGVVPGSRKGSGLRRGRSPVSHAPVSPK